MIRFTLKIAKMFVLLALGFLIGTFYSPAIASADFTFPNSNSTEVVKDPIVANVSWVPSDVTGGFGTPDWVCFILSFADGSRAQTNPAIPYTGTTGSAIGLQFDVTITTYVEYIHGFGWLSNDCSEDNDYAGGTAIDFGGQTVNLLTVASLTPPSNTTWGSSNGFWGDTFTTDEVLDTMVASVQATGEGVYPLLVFVGIPLALIIALAVVGFMQQSVEDKKLTRRVRKTIKRTEKLLRATDHS